MVQPGVRAEIDHLQSAALDATEDIQTAEQLEAQAGKLREGAPLRVDRAIRTATEQLIVDAEAGTLSPRDSLEFVLDINQYKPSRVAWSGPVDKPKILDAFDRLSQADTPLMIKVGPSDGVLYAGITGSHPLTVKVYPATGMGGLPGADIGFSSREVSHSKNDPGSIAIAETVQAVRLRQLAKGAVGQTALQALLDGIAFESHDHTCGHGYNSNEYSVRETYDTARALALISGISLDMTIIDSEIQKAIQKHAQEENRRRIRAEYAAKRPVRYR